MIQEPPPGSTILLGEPGLQAGWCYYRAEEGWVRVFSSGRLDRWHALDWEALASHHPAVVERPPYVPGCAWNPPELVEGGQGPG